MHGIKRADLPGDAGRKRGQQRDEKYELSHRIFLVKLLNDFFTFH